jgi:hypothetical protein
MKRDINRRLDQLEAATDGASFVVVFAGEPIPAHARKLVIVVPKRGDRSGKSGKAHGEYVR